MNKNIHLWFALTLGSLAAMFLLCFCARDFSTTLDPSELTEEDKEWLSDGDLDGRADSIQKYIGDCALSLDTCLKMAKVLKARSFTPFTADSLTLGVWNCNTVSDKAVIDQSGNNLRGVIKESLESDRGIQDKGLLFSGQGYVSIENKLLESLQVPFSLEAWVNPALADAEKPIRTLFSHAGGFVMFMDRNQLYSRVSYGGAPLLVRGGPLHSKAWNYVALTVGADSAHIYVNGEKTGTKPVSSDNTLDGGGVTLSWGAPHTGGNDSGFYGVLDEIRISQTVRTQEEISRIWHQNNKPATLVASFPFHKDLLNTSLYDLNSVATKAFLSADRFGMDSSGCSFDGLESNIRVKHDAVLEIHGDLSICFWVKFSTLDDCGLMGKHHAGAYYSYAVWYETGDLWFTVGSNAEFTQKVHTSSLDSANVFYHVAAVYDRNFLKIYTNGQEANRLAETRTPRTGPANLCIGSVRKDCFNADQLTKAPQNFFNGVLDDIRIYNRAISEEEISILYGVGGWPDID